MKFAMLSFVGCILLISLNCASSQPHALHDALASINSIKARISSNPMTNSIPGTGKNEEYDEGKSVYPTTYLPYGYTKFSGCDLGFNTAYRFHPFKKTWEDAKMSCYQEGGYLAYPDCAEEDKRFHDILKFMRSGGAWLGMTDRHQEGDWITVHGDNLSDLSYVNWALTEPNNYGPEGEDCAELYLDGKWYDMSCEKKLFYFCKIDLSYNESPTVIQSTF